MAIDTFSEQQQFFTDPVAGDELTLASRLADLHQLLYVRGGIKPVNAAVEEMSKLLLLRIAAHRFPETIVPGEGLLLHLLDPIRVHGWTDTSPLKAAFTYVIAHEDLRGTLPDGTSQPVWPPDEPLRISRPDVLAEALDVISSVVLSDAGRNGVDPLGTAFDAFLQGRYDHAGGLGTYLTPASVARAMARIGFELLGHDPEGPVGDPCCGTGRFLAAIIAERLSRWPALGESDVTCGLVGADQSPVSIAMARVNLLAYGAHHPRLFTVDDSVIDSALDRLSGTFELILTNPPFGDSKYDSQLGIRRSANVLVGLEGRKRIDPSLAFVARCVELLAPNGVAGIVLPDGVLDGPILRTAFLEDPSQTGVTVEGILSLPTVTFAPAGTMAKTSVLFIRKGPSRRERVFVARADHVGYLKNARGVVPDPDGDDLPRIADQVVALLRNEEVSPLASDLTAELARLSLGSLDASTFDLEAVDARAELVRSGGVEFSTILRTVRSRRRRSGALDMPFVSVLHVDELGAIDWAEAEVYRPTTPGLTAPSGSVIVSLLNPRKFRAAVIPDCYTEVQCSAEFGVFEAKIDPYAALALLQHPLVRAQIAPMGRGTSSSRRRVSEEDVLSLVAPPYDRPWELATGAKAQEYFRTLASVRRGLRDLFTIRE